MIIQLKFKQLSMQSRVTGIESTFYLGIQTDSPAEQMACVWRMSVDVEGAVFNWMTGTTLPLPLVLPTASKL
jgi:hypothetical protein